MTLRRATVACGRAAASACCSPSTPPITLALGVAFLIAFVVCGVFLIAEPGFLEGDDKRE